ncbi:MAG: phasin family protein [Burkholderiaceae bacterium]
MKETNNNRVASYIEAQMAGTAGIVQAAMHGVQRVQEILMRAMREGAGGQMALARSISGARDAADISRVGEAHAGPAAEQFTRYQQELIGAVTEMNTEMVQASYSMMERISQALAGSSSAMGLPVGGQAGGPMAAFEAGMRQWQGAMEQLTQGVPGQAGGPMAAFEAGMRQWQGAMEQLTQGVRGQASDQEGEDDEGDEEEVEEPKQRQARKAVAKRTGRR